MAGKFRQGGEIMGWWGESQSDPQIVVDWRLRKPARADEQQIKQATDILVAVGQLANACRRDRSPVFSPIAQEVADLQRRDSAEGALPAEMRFNLDGTLDKI